MPRGVGLAGEWLGWRGSRFQPDVHKGMAHARAHRREPCNWRGLPSHTQAGISIPHTGIRVMELTANVPGRTRPPHLDTQAPHIPHTLAAAPEANCAPARVKGWSVSRKPAVKDVRLLPPPELGHSRMLTALGGEPDTATVLPCSNTSSDNRSTRPHELSGMRHHFSCLFA